MSNNIYYKRSPGVRAPFNGFNPDNLYLNRDPNNLDAARPLTWALNTVSGAIFYMASSSAGLYNWVDVSGGAGTFATLTVTGNTTLGSAAGSVITIGNTSGATSITESVGTGNFVLSGAAGSNLTFGTGITSGALAFGGALTTGLINLGNVSMTGQITIGTSSSGQTIVINNGTNTGATVTTINGGASGANSTVNILSGVSTAGTQTLNVLTGAGTNGGALNLGTGASVVVTAIGNATSTSSTTITAGTGGLALVPTGGNATLTPATVSAAAYSATLNAHVGQVTLTGQVLAAGATQDLAITNSVISGTTQSVFVSVDNLGSNDAQIQVQRILLAASTLTVKVKNVGAAALNGNIHVNFWVVN